MTGYDEKIKNAITELILGVGENPNREGLQKTPERVAHMYHELLKGYEIDPKELINGAVFDLQFDGFVSVNNIQFSSLCEHHLLPFVGRAKVAYIPNGKVIGLSKIPRIVDMFSRRLQVQERLTAQIADHIDEVLHPRGVVVVLEAIHLCVVSRGVKSAQSWMVTSVHRGNFQGQESALQEFMRSGTRHLGTTEAGLEDF